MVPEEMPLSLVSKSGYILYPVIFSGSQRPQQGKPIEKKKSVLSQHDKEKQSALKHGSSALSYSPLLFSNKKEEAVFS